MPYVDKSPLLDVGAGAGLPGIVLSIISFSAMFISFAPCVSNVFIFYKSLNTPIK
jgi:hypothetical protein